MYTIIYTNCSTEAFGDYSIAISLALTLIRNGFFYGNHSCLLASDAKGLSIFKKMFPEISDGKLNIYNNIIQLIDLETVSQDNDKYKVINYIEVGFCHPAPIEVVEKIIQPITKVLFVGLPNSNEIEFKLFYQERYPEFEKWSRMSFIMLGFNFGRAGVLNYSIPSISTEEILPANFFNDKYGFIYFNANGERAEKFIYDYIRIAHQVYSCKNYVLVGNTEVSTKALFDFADQAGNIPFQILQFANLPHEKMYAMMQSAIPFIGTTGTSSLIESFMLKKLTLYQFLNCNAELCKAYKQAAFNFNYTNTLDVGNFIEKQVWKEPLSIQQMQIICDFLSHRLREELIAFNERLVNKFNVAESVARVLGVKLKKSSHNKFHLFANTVSVNHSKTQNNSCNKLGCGIS